MQLLSNIILIIFLSAVCVGAIVLMFGNDTLGGYCIITAIVTFFLHNFVFKNFVEDTK